jgi:DNA-binding phage protein
MMALELKDWDVLDFIKDDEGLASLLDDALATRHEGYISDVAADVERAKGLASDASLTLMARVMRAADAVGAKVGVLPLEAEKREAA